MDSLTHVMCGIGIASIAATINPALADYQVAAIGCGILSSSIQDFDIVTKFINNTLMLKHHRGFSHTIYALPILALLSTLLFIPFITLSIYLSLLLISIISLLLHTSLDCLNSYGTKALNTRTWIRLSIIHTIDPIVTIVLLSNTFLYFIFNINFIPAFFIIFIYIIFRTIYKKIIIHNINKNPSIVEIKSLIAESHPFKWYAITKTKDKYYTFEIRLSKIINQDYHKKLKIDDELYKIIKGSKSYNEFASFTPFHVVEDISFNKRIIIKATDLRYRTNTHYYFFNYVCEIKDNKIVNDYIGWVYSEEKLLKKIGIKYI